ncbi:MAG: transposase [Deltaproteobacteria bacterium]|nr:transposase [Deltaproteobacteria bacterium]MBI3295562.1 transposase [Deltaproteobacteria bacterium]
MPRQRLIKSSIAPYHVTIRANNREWFKLPLPIVWEIFCECLQLTQTRFGCDYFAFVLMANHIHLLVGTPEANLGSAMRYLFTEASRRIARASKRINKIFGARYHWTILHKPRDLAYVYKYVHRNPVKARICESVEVYPFSTLTQLNNGHCDIAIGERLGEYSTALPRDHNVRLRWLNQPTEKEAEKLIGRALRRFEFQFTTGNEFQKQLRMLRATYGVEQDMTATY